MTEDLCAEAFVFTKHLQNTKVLSQEKRTSYSLLP